MVIGSPLLPVPHPLWIYFMLPPREDGRKWKIKWDA